MKIYLDRNVEDVNLGALADDDLLVYDEATQKWVNKSLTHSISHSMLSATHTDITSKIGVMALGNLLYVVNDGGTLAWDVLPIGLSGQELVSSGSFPAWRYADGWTNRIDETWTYASATTFTVDGDVTAYYTPGVKIRMYQSEYKYFYVVSSSYSSPNTTVTVTAGSTYTIANATISGRAVSYEESPVGFPDWFAWTPTETGWTDTPTGVYRFNIKGRTVYFNISTTAGTSDTEGAVLTLPLTSANINTAMLYTGACGLCYDNSAALTTPCRWVITNNSANITFYKDMVKATWTASGTKRVSAQGFYQF